VAAVSDRALIMLAATEESLAQEGTSPHRIRDNSLMGSFGFWWITGTWKRSTLSHYPLNRLVHVLAGFLFGRFAAGVI
jgi:hypothetical protein